MAEGASITRSPLDRRWPWAGAAVAAASVPLVFLGPGTDLDTGVVIRSGRSLVGDGDYVASRPPGAPVHEAIVGVLDRLGGTVATNLGSLAAAVAATIAVVALLRRAGVGHPGLAAAVMVANPFFVIAATSTVDFLFALAFVLWAAVAAHDGRAVGAGVLAALAIGCRVGSVVLVAAVVVAELTEGSSGRRRAATVALVAGAGGVLAFLPSYLAAGESLAFAQNEFSTSSPLVQLGKFGVKNLYFFGPFAAVALAFAVAPTAGALRRWRSSWTIRFAVTGLLLSQALYLRFPWKLGHLLPSLACLALLLGVALTDRPRLLAAVVAAQLVYALVNVQFVRPDDPNQATGGRLTLTPAWGALVVDTGCRSDDTTAWETNDRARLEAVWNCAKPWTPPG